MSYESPWERWNEEQPVTADRRDREAAHVVLYGRPGVPGEDSKASRWLETGKSPDEPGRRQRHQDLADAIANARAEGRAEGRCEELRHLLANLDEQADQLEKDGDQHGAAVLRKARDGCEPPVIG